MNKKNTQVLILSMICLFTNSILIAQNRIEGTWQPEGKQARFKIYEEGGKFFGQLIGSDNPDEDKEIKGRDSIILLRNLEKKSDTEYCCGVFFAPENKKRLSAALTLASENRIELKLKMSWFRKTVVWIRIEN